MRLCNPVGRIDRAGNHCLRALGIAFHRAVANCIKLPLFLVGMFLGETVPSLSVGNRLLSSELSKVRTIFAGPIQTFMADVSYGGVPVPSGRVVPRRGRPLPQYLDSVPSPL